jgi:hypothetical protein
MQKGFFVFVFSFKIFEDIEVLDRHIESISEKRIVFKESVKNVLDIWKNQLSDSNKLMHQSK